MNNKRTTYTSGYKELEGDHKTICRLIRQLRLMALTHGGTPDVSTLYDAAEWLQRLAGLTREQTEQVNK